MFQHLLAWSFIGYFLFLGNCNLYLPSPVSSAGHIKKIMMWGFFLFQGKWSHKQQQDCCFFMQWGDWSAEFPRTGLYSMWSPKTNRAQQPHIVNHQGLGKTPDLTVCLGLQKWNEKKGVKREAGCKTMSFASELATRCGGEEGNVVEIP